MKESRCFLLGCMFERRAPCVMNELPCEKVGNLFQVETIHFIGGKTLHLPGRITNED